MNRAKLLKRRFQVAATYAAVAATVITGIPVPALNSVLGPSQARAADEEWINFNGGNFSVGANWQNGLTPFAGDPTNVLIFGGSTGYTVTNDAQANFSVQELRFTNTGSALSILTGSSFLFDGASASITQNG